MRKILFMFVLFFSSYAFSGECIVFEKNGKQATQACEVQLLGGGGNWISEKLVMADRQFYLMIGDCAEDSKGEEVCSNVQLTTDERDLFSDGNEASIYGLNMNMKPVRYDPDGDWICLKREDGSLNVCYKED